MNLTKEQIINELEEIIKYNKAARQASCLELFKDASRKSNDVLAKAKNYIKSSDEYERGANDAWELARKIGRHPVDGGYDCDELYLRFDSYNTSDVFNEYTYQEALAKIKAYEKKKEEEAAKPKLGDVVELTHRNRIGQETYVRGIYLQETDETHNVVVDSGNVYIFEKESVVSINKTGDFLDIPGTLRFIK